MELSRRGFMAAGAAAAASVAPVVADAAETTVSATHGITAMAQCLLPYSFRGTSPSMLKTPE